MPPDERAAVQTFLLADLCGYTALTEAHGDEHAAELVAEFCATMRDRLPRYDADEVKTIGDAVLVRVPEAHRAVGLALDLMDALHRRHGFPSVRVGMHSGPAVERGGDWFGSAVNLAARVTDAAAPGQVVATAATRAAAEGAGASFRALGSRRLKNVAEPVELFEVLGRTAREAGDLPIDPVCRMAVDPERGSERRVHRGAEYHFCSSECAERFDREPQRYARRSRGADLRVSDAARERTAAALRRAFERGRLSPEELEERLESAYRARTRAELSGVVADLPERHGLRRAARRERSSGRILRRLRPRR